MAWVPYTPGTATWTKLVEDWAGLFQRDAFQEDAFQMDFWEILETTTVTWTVVPSVAPDTWTPLVTTTATWTPLT